MKMLHKVKSHSWERSWLRIARSLRVFIGFSCVVFVTAAQVNTATYNQTVLSTLSKISASGASGQSDTAEQLFRVGKEAGLSELQMYEAVLNLLPYIGYPRTLSTLGRFQKVYPDYIAKRSQGKTPKSTEPWQEYAPEVWGERGAKVQEQLAGGSEANEELVQQLS